LLHKGLHQRITWKLRAKNKEIQTLRQQNELFSQRLNMLTAAVKSVVERIKEYMKKALFRLGWLIPAVACAHACATERRQSSWMPGAQNGRS
jgi:methanogenic corrinoid protein MtbC1